MCPNRYVILHNNHYLIHCFFCLEGEKNISIANFASVDFFLPEWHFKPRLVHIGFNIVQPMVALPLLPNVPT